MVLESIAMEITIGSKIWFWTKFFAVQVFLFFPVGMLSVILYPISYFFRYVLKLDLFYYLLNSTVDGDFGDDNWRQKHNLEKGFWTGWRWTLRNSAWNFKGLFRPKWRAGETEAFETIKNTFDNKWQWASKSGRQYGLNHCYYIVDGTTYGRFSFADRYSEIQLGAGGDGYKFKLKGLILAVAAALALIPIYYIFF